MNHTTSTRGRPAGWMMAAALLASLSVATAQAQSPTQGASGGAAPKKGPCERTRLWGASAKSVAAQLKQFYGGRSDVQIYDTASDQVVIQGPNAEQEAIFRWLNSEGFVAPPQTTYAVQTVAYNEPQKVVTRTWQLQNMTARDFESKLAKTWGTSLQSSQDQVGDVATFRFPATAAGTTSIVVDRRANTATVTAPKQSANSWERLISILDSRSTSADERTSIVPLVKADPVTIRRAISLIAQVFSASGARRKQHVGQFVSMLFQEGAQPEGGAQPAAPPPAPAPAGDITAQAAASGGASAASIEAIARINNVQIEILDDVIVVRGRKEDVDRVLQIIEQIEQQSIQFKPEIELITLKHVDSGALNEMITQIAAAAFPRQGPVTVIPMQRPNAVLLIGRKENIPALVELISKLDQPAPTDAEFKIFKLNHMSAIDAERTVRSFFVERPPTTPTPRTGLGTRAIIIAEYRLNAILVQAAPRDMIEITALIKQLDVPDSGATQEVRVFKLRNAVAATIAPILEEAVTAATATTQATQAQGQAAATPARATPPAVSLQFLRIGPDGEQLIKSGIMANVRITADAQGNTLIVVGPPAAMGLMAALIEQLDRLPSSEAQIKVFTVRNGDATALAEMLTNLFGTPAAGAQGAQPGQGAATASGDSAIVPLRFSVDQRTNSIIASGNAGDLNVIYAILTRLDEGDIRQRSTVVYRLRNAPAQDVSNALTTLLAQQLTLIQSAPELVTPVEAIERQVIVVAEPVTNSLIISATSRYFTEIQRIIGDLDRRPPMIVIQVCLAEVNLNDTEQFGVEWGLQDALMFDRSASATGNRFNFNNAILPNDPTAQSLATRNNVATQGLANFALGRTDPTLGFGGLVLTASNESVSVLLRALEQSSRAQIISRPQVQTLDNIPAFVQVGAAVPRIQGALATGQVVTPLVNDINVGIVLNVTPRTSPDGTIVMQVYAEKSSVGPDATGIPVFTDAQGNVVRSPQIPKTLAQTTVSARSGQTVVLGGLITKEQNETTRRVPYLGDIPLLGRLFRFDAVTNKRTELLVILTPYLVQTTEQMDWINSRESERMSWCVADIVNIHGPVPVSGNPAFNAGTPLIYPDLEPGAPPPVIQPNLPQMPYPPFPAGPPLPPNFTMPAGATPEPTNPPATTPTPATPPPPQPGLPPPGPQPMGLSPPYQDMPYRDVQPGGVPGGGIVVPQPASLLPTPAGAPPRGAMSPRPIESAVPPAGTDANYGERLPSAPIMGMRPSDPSPYPPMGMPSGVTPAVFQQPVAR